MAMSMRSLILFIVVCASIVEACIYGVREDGECRWWGDFMSKETLEFLRCPAWSDCRYAVNGDCRCMTKDEYEQYLECYQPIFKFMWAR